MTTLGSHLETGSPLPAVTWQMLDGTSLNPALDLKSRWSVICILRGHW